HGRHAATAPNSDYLAKLRKRPATLFAVRHRDTDTSAFQRAVPNSLVHFPSFHGSIDEWFREHAGWPLPTPNSASSYSDPTPDGSRPSNPHKKLRRTYFTPDSTLPFVCARYGRHSRGVKPQ